MNKFNIYKIIWDFTEDFYHMTGLSILPNALGPWLFGKMIGVKGVRIK